MKKSGLISLCTIVLLAILGTGCSNENVKAQALLVEAISWSEGHPSSDAACTAAVKLAADHGFHASNNGSGLTDVEIIMIAGRLRCDEVLSQYPSTPAAVKAAEVRGEINGRLRDIANERISNSFRND